LTLRSAVLTVLLIPLLSACSWVFVESPPEGYERFNYVPCTRSKVVPVIDASVAAASAWVTLMLMTSDDFADKFEGDNTLLNIPGASYSKAGGVLAFLGSGALAGYNANLGFKRVSACRDAQLEVAARNRSMSPESPELPEAESPTLPQFSWLDRLFPLPSLGADAPALPVVIPAMHQ